MTEPGEDRAAGAHGVNHLPVLRADREQVIEVLKAAFVQGRLDRDELGMRVGQALASRRYADLVPLVADMPAGLIDSRPPGPAQVSVSKTTVVVVACATAALVAMWSLVGMAPSGSALALAAVVVTGVLVIILPACWLVLFEACWSSRKYPGSQSAR